MESLKQLQGKWESHVQAVDQAIAELRLQSPSKPTSVLSVLRASEPTPAVELVPATQVASASDEVLALSRKLALAEAELT